MESHLPTWRITISNPLWCADRFYFNLNTVLLYFGHRRSTSGLNPQSNVQRHRFSSVDCDRFFHVDG